jgi:thioredoxin reductase
VDATGKGTVPWCLSLDQLLNDLEAAYNADDFSAREELVDKLYKLSNIVKLHEELPHYTS